MSWFNRNKVSKDMIKVINPTSKSSLKVQCLLIANGDIDKAQRLYDFYAHDMPEIPDYDKPSPTWLDNTKSTLNGIFSFIGEHKDGISQGYEMIRTILNSRGANLPPLATAVDAAAEAASEIQLPPINE